MKKEYLKIPYHNHSFGELCGAPVLAFAKIDEKQAKELRQRFQLRTILDLANFRFYLWANQLLHLVELDDEARELSGIYDAFHPTYRQFPIEDILHAPLTAFKEINQEDFQFFKKKFHVSSVEDMAYFIFAKWAQEICSSAIGQGKKDEPLPSMLSLLSIRRLLFLSLLAFSIFALTTYAFRSELGLRHPAQNEASKTTQDESSSLLDDEKNRALEKKEEPVPTQNETTVPERRQEPPPLPAYRDYTVRYGDTLARISQQFLGNGKRWQEIYQLNRDKIADPRDLRAGTRLILPQK